MKTEINGVTTFWEQGAVPLTGILMFGVGVRDEAFRTAEITHLVEHLVMRTLPKSHLDHNAHVDLDSTAFFATGRPEELVDFFARVSAALRDLPTQHLEQEAGVLEVEGSMAEHPAACWALGMRFGHSGPGLASSSGPGVTRLSPREVKEFVATHFVRENAVMILTGPPPDGLSLDLPPGPAPADSPENRTGLLLPAMIREDLPHPTLSFEMPGHHDHRSVLGAILTERLTDDLRHVQGIAYDCGFTHLRLANSTMIAVHSDGHENKRDVIAKAMWSTLQDLALNGPTQTELEHELAGVRAGLEDPRSLDSWLATQGWRTLIGLSSLSRAEYLASLDQVSTSQVQAWARSGLDSTLLGVPADLDVTVDGLPDRTEEYLPTTDAVEGEVFGRKMLAIAPLDLQVVVGEAGISQTAYKHTVASHWERVVGVATADGARSVILETGQTILLTRRHLKNADRLFEIVDEKLEHLTFERPLDELLGR